MRQLTKELLKALKKNLERPSDKYYSFNMDKETEKRVQKIINDTKECKF